MFYTHDDWFHFYLAKNFSFRDFIFPPQNWGHYRPLSTQLVYLLTGTDPVRSFLLILFLFIILIFLIYLFCRRLDPKHAKLATLFYALSPTHFGHLYSLANQELVHAIFYLLSLITYLKNRYFLSLLMFISALMSKEFAITLPFILLTLKPRRQIIYYFIILFLYLGFRVFHYGLASGESYIWGFQPSTLIWYFLWSLGLPEMLPDFIGPGLHLNPNLLRYWSFPVIPIFVIFALLGVFIIFNWRFLRFRFLLWFLITISPVLFLPWHRFTFYLTLPLIGISLFLAPIISRQKLILLIYLLLSYFTYSLTLSTHWLATGPKVAKRVYQHLNQLYLPSQVIFYDTPEDQNLLYSPSQQLKLILSDQHFFQTAFSDQITAQYLTTQPENSSALMLRARDFFK